MRRNFREEIFLKNVWNVKRSYFRIQHAALYYAYFYVHSLIKPLRKVHFPSVISTSNFTFKVKKKTLCVVTIAMICSNLASPWKFQYFRRPIYNPVEHLWWSFNCKNSTSLNILKCSIIDACFGSKYASAFWRLFKRFISLKYFTL